MKKTKKILALALAAVMLVCTTVAATVAYLTSKTEVVKNTFTVGNVVITLDEAKVDANGKKVTPEERVTANSYKLLPNHEYDKDPTVHVGANSEDCWVFVQVKNEIKNALKADLVIGAEWEVFNAEKGIYASKAIRKANDNIVVFNGFQVSDKIDNATLATYSGKTITIEAYAIQADGFTTAQAAWDAAKLTAWLA